MRREGTGWIPAMALVLSITVVPAAMALPGGAGWGSPNLLVRAALGDIPTTDPVEPPGQWNAEERRTMWVDGEGPATATFRLPPGALFGAMLCDCGAVDMQVEGDAYTQHFPSGLEASEYTVLFRYALAVNASSPFAYVIPEIPHEDRNSTLVLLYVPDTMTVTSPVEAEMVLPSTSENPGRKIHIFNGDDEMPLPGSLTFVLAAKAAPIGDATMPDQASAARRAAPAAGATADGGLTKVLYVAVGIVIGALGWSMLDRVPGLRARTGRRGEGDAADGETDPALGPGGIEAATE